MGTRLNGGDEGIRTSSRTPGQRKRLHDGNSGRMAFRVKGTRTALAPTRLANDAIASSAIALRQVERRSAPTQHPTAPVPTFYVCVFRFIVKGYFFYRKYRSHSAQNERYFLPLPLILLEDISVPYSLLEERVGIVVLLCSCEDFLDYCCLGIGVVLHVFPVVASKFLLVRS